MKLTNLKVFLLLVIGSFFVCISFLALDSIGPYCSYASGLEEVVIEFVIREGVGRHEPYHRVEPVLHLTVPRIVARVRQLCHYRILDS